MNRKSGNDKYDIVIEAQAVLAAYNERCKVYEKKVNRHKGRSFKSVCFYLVLSGLCALGVWWVLQIT